MKRAITKIDKLIILCRNVQKTSSIYSEALGLRVFVQSPSFVELRDSSNFCVYLQQSKSASQLSKGYSPMLSFRVQNFDQVYKKLVRSELTPDGDIIEIKQGKIASFLGLDGETISINNIKSQEDDDIQDQQSSLQDDEIKRILQKIKL